MTLPTTVPPVNHLRTVTQLAMEGRGFGSQALPAIQGSGSQTFSPSWSGNQTFPPSPPWSGDQGIEHQGYSLSASTPTNQTMLQQSLPPLVSLPSPDESLPFLVFQPLPLLAGLDQLVDAPGELCQPW